MKVLPYLPGQSENTYASTFISGLGRPIDKLLRENLDSVSIKTLMDGLVLYSSKENAKRIKSLRFFNNSFLLLAEFLDLPSRGDVFSRMMESTYDIDLGLLLRRPFLGVRSFRIVTSDENQLVSTDKQLVQQLGKRISAIRGLNVHVNQHNPQAEIWFLRRRENIGFLLLRLTKNVTNKKLSPGQLRPELAHILCALAETSKEDVCLDPFSGSGSIPLELVERFPSKLVFAGDHRDDSKKTIRSRIKTKKAKTRLIPKTQDALNMISFQDGFISKIITDPPWGEYEPIDDIISFYSAMMREFLRVLDRSGIIVLLTAKKNEIELVLADYGDAVTLQEKYDILVSGKKVGVYKLKKT